MFSPYGTVFRARPEIFTFRSGCRNMCSSPQKKIKNLKKKNNKSICKLMVLPSESNIPAKKKSKKNNLVISDDIDRVSNITQKETALSVAGVTRAKVYLEIKGMLDAVKVEEEMVDGRILTTEVPDMAVRAKGVELALKAFGDLKEFDRALGSVTHNKVIYQWNTVVVPTVVDKSGGVDNGRGVG